MSQRDNSEQNYGSARSQARTERGPNPDPEDLARLHQTERQLHADSPTRHDVEFYVRKVNRYEVEIGRLEHELSVARFKLSKAEDFEIKYDILFKENQKTVAEHLALLEEHDRTLHQLDRTSLLQEQTAQQARTLRAELEAEKRERETQTAKKEELRSKTTSQGQEEREALKEGFARELETLKKEHRDALDKLKRENSELRNTIALKEVTEGSLAAKL